MTLPKVALDRLRQLKKIQEQDARIRKAFGPNRKIEDAIAFCRTYLEFNDFVVVPDTLNSPKDVWVDLEEIYEIFSYPDDIKEGQLHPEWKKQLDFCNAFLLECGFKEILDKKAIPSIPKPKIDVLAKEFMQSLPPKKEVIPLEYFHRLDVLFVDSQELRETKLRTMHYCIDHLCKHIKEHADKFVEMKQEHVTNMEGEFIYTKVKIRVEPIK